MVSKNEIEFNFIDAPSVLDEMTDDDRCTCFSVLLDRLAKGRRLYLYTLSSKIAFLNGLCKFSNYELRAFHVARQAIEAKEFPLSVKQRAAFAFTITRMAAFMWPEQGIDWQVRAEQWTAQDDWSYQQVGERACIRGVVSHVDQETYQLHVVDDETQAHLTALGNVADVNESFNVSIGHLGTRIPLPIQVNFLDNTFIDATQFIPKAIIVDPDYLVDVTAIAECFSADTVMPLNFLMKQFTPKTVSPYLLLGHVANAMLDQFLLNRSVSFDDIMQELFQQFVLEFSLLNDDDVKMVAQQAKEFMQHLFQDAGILNQENKNTIAYIEPAFISGKHGLQGRLDAFFMDETLHAGKIVELKSGKPYKVNEFGLNPNHYAQTLLYDLAVKDAFGDDFVSTNYILYCKLKQDRLRRAPTLLPIQYEAMKVRNDLIAIVHHLMSVQDEGLLFRFDHGSFAAAGGFIYRDAQLIASTINQLSEFEKRHLQFFVKFITGENYVAKVGGFQYQRRMGFSALWRADVDDKLIHFNIYRHLAIQKKLSDDVYQFSIPEGHTLTNFRRGDIVVLYPASREEHPTHGQLLRGSIIRLTACDVQVRLRNPLLRSEVFEAIEAWNIEHDFIEASTRNDYRSLFSFYRSSPQRRNIFMGICPPSVTEENIPYEIVSSLSDIQSQLLIEMIRAGEYYLLWGPPGTGKTSVMLAAYIRYIMEYTSENLLLVAYTNRAVDEICAVIDQLYPDDYVRIGSRFSVGERFQKKLLQSKIASKKSRNQVLTFLESSRLFVGTAASISGRDELFELKSFDRMVVDEASQILEPQLIGLSSRIPRNVFIGDHKQLPAVVAAPPSYTTIDSPQLNAAGYQDSGMSMFERLYRRCDQQGWVHAVGRLSHQGRMHTDINAFVSASFYDRQLHIIEHAVDIRLRLTQALTAVYDQFPLVDGRKLSRRMEIVDSLVVESKDIGVVKMQAREAVLVADICGAVLDVLPEHMTVGVICPFRAQIALVRDELQGRGLSEHPRLNVDTVERYQGGARDVIILSTCATNAATLQAIRSLDADGIDRKLNVAISRSREQFILVGSLQVLAKDETYRELIGYSDDLDS